MRLIALLLASIWFVAANPASAAVCNDDMCIEFSHSSGGIFANLTSYAATKASPGLVAVNYDPDIDPVILIGAFNDGGFSCSGSIGPSAGTPTGPGAGTLTQFGCTYQLHTGDMWRITITISWFFNAEIGEWQVADIQAEAKLIKSPFQNQVR